MSRKWLFVKRDDRRIAAGIGDGGGRVGVGGHGWEKHTSGAEAASTGGGEDAGDESLAYRTKA